MPQMVPGKWTGVDILSLLMGGNDNKVAAAQKGIEELGSVIKTINDLKTFISGGIDKAASELQGEVGKLLKKSPLSSFFNEVERIKQDIENLKGASVYFLDMNTSTPPIWSFGLTESEINVTLEISDNNAKINEIKAKGLPLEEEEVETEYYVNRNTILREKLDTIRNESGGLSRYLNVFNASLDDTFDSSRPIFNDKALISSLFILYGSASLGEFFELFEALKSLLRSFSLATPDIVGPLERLTVKYVNAEASDQEYAQIGSLYEEGKFSFKKKNPGALDPHIVITIKNKEKNIIEDYIGVLLTSDQIEEIFDTEATPSSSGANEETLEEAKENKIVLFELQGKDKSYYSSREFQVIVNEKRCVDDNIPVETIYNEGGWISYVPGGKAFGSLRRETTIWPMLDSINSTNIIPDVLESGVANLYWYYPKVSFLLTRAIKAALDTRTTYTNTYIFKKRITADDPFDDLTLAILNNSAPKIGPNLEVKVVSALWGARKSYVDLVENIQTAFANKTLGYQYAVANGYVVYYTIKRVARTNRWPVDFPTRVAVYDENIAEDKKLIQDLEKVRKETFDALDKHIADGTSSDKEIAQELKDFLEERFCVRGKSLEYIPRIKISLSNVAELIIPTDYDLTLSVPPDWKRFPNLTMAFPKLFQALDTITSLMDTFFNYIKDAYDFIPELASAFKDEVSFYLDKITAVLETLSDIIRAISKLTFGIYAMTLYSTTGLNTIRKMLAMSMTGNLEEVPWKNESAEAYAAFQMGPPPFDEDDYVSGYVFLAGGPEFLIDLYKGLDDSPTVDQFVNAGEQWIKDNIPDYGKEITDEVYALVDKAGKKNRDKSDQVYADTGDRSESVASVVEVVDLSEEDDLEKAMEIAYLSDATARLNSGQLGELAGDLANSMDCSFGYSDAGAAASSLKNYDGSPITDPSILAFFDALLHCGRDRMAYAASLLKYTKAQLPFDAALFINPEDVTALNNFLLLLGKAISDQLASIPLHPGMQGVFVTINPFDNIEDIGVDLEGDTYQVGLNVAVYNFWDPRRLGVLVHNESLEVLTYNTLMEILMLNGEMEIQGYNEQWEVHLFDPEVQVI